MYIYSVHTGLWNNNSVALAIEAEISRGGQVRVYTYVYISILIHVLLYYCTVICFTCCILCTSACVLYVLSL